MSHWIHVSSLEDIPPLGARQIRLCGVDIALFRTREDRVFAIEDRCPHKGGPLSQGIVYGNAVACPLHSMVIDLELGEARAPDEGCVRRFPVRLVDGAVEFDRAALVSEAAE